MRKILLLGGTGAMGIHLSKYYSSSNENDVYITSRKMHVSKDNNIHYIEGNAKSLEFLKSLATNKWDIVVDFMIYSSDEFKERVDLLLNMAGVYLFLSSARVYALSDSALNEESARLIDINQDKKYINSQEYAIEKAKEENILFESKNRNWIIIRPYITFDSYRLQLGIYEKENWLYRVIHGKTLVITDDILSKLTTLTYGKDVAQVIYSISLNTACKGQVIQAAEPSYFQWQDILNMYIKHLQKICGCKVKIKRMENIDCLYEVYSRYQLKYDRLGNRFFDSSKVEKYIDIKWTSLTDSIEASLKEFIASPVWKNINWKSEALMDKIVGEHTSFAEMPDFRTKMLYCIYRYTPYPKIIFVVKKIKRKLCNYS